MSHDFQHRLSRARFDAAAPMLRLLLADMLGWISEHDPSADPGRFPTDESAEWAYNERNDAIMSAVAFATQVGFQAGFKPDGDDTEYVLAFIDLPTGQVSWHVPAYPAEWDNHTTEEKYRRVEAYIKDESGGQ
jgi:hypothetical protein